MSQATKQEKVKELLLLQNLQRIRYGFAIGALITFLHVAYFLYQLPDTDLTTHAWRLGIISVHALLFIVFLIQGIFVLLPKLHALLTQSVGWHFMLANKLALLFGGVALAVIDQMVISAITPYLILSFTVALIYLIQPYKSALLFSLAYLLLFFTLPITQHDPDVLASLRVNALSITLISILLSIILWHTSKKNLFQGLIIKEQKRKLEATNATLRSQARELSELNKTKDKFFSIIAHDLKSPFNVVKGFGELLEDELRDSGNAAVGSYIEAIQSSTDRAMHLLDNLMEWARSQTGKIDFNPVELNLLKQVDETLAFYAEAARKKSITLIAQIDDRLTVYADMRMLNSVLHNLISNAIKFTRENGEVVIKSKSLDGEVLISVHDNGIGMQDNILQNLFHVDKNIGRAGTHGEPSIGLGLQLCKEFVERHQGKIWAESAEEQGTTLYFTLPVKSEP